VRSPSRNCTFAIYRGARAGAVFQPISDYSGSVHETGGTR